MSSYVPAEGEKLTGQLEHVKRLDGLRMSVGLGMAAAEAGYSVLFERIEAINKALGDVALGTVGIHLVTTEKFTYPGDSYTPVRDIEPNFGFDLRGAFHGFTIFDRKSLDLTGDMGRTGIREPADRYEISVELGHIDDGLDSVPFITTVPANKLEEIVDVWRVE